jgi:sugar lactone lactonase YvrE
LVARLQLPTSAVTVKGEKLSGLPPTLAAVMQSARTTGLRTERDEVKVTQATPYIVSGGQTLMITVRRKDLSEAPRPLGPSGSGSAPGVPDPSSVPSDGPVPSEGSGPTPVSTEGDTETDIVRMLAAGAAAPPAPKRSAGTPPAPPAPPSSASSEGAASSAPTPADAAADTTVKPVGRLPQIWRQGSMSDFSAGTLKNAAITSLGDVRLSPSLQKVADTTENYIWAMLPDGKGNLYLGTGDGGVIYKMDAAGKVLPFFQTKELEVTSLALDASGNLYAGTVPNGIVFQISPDGKGSKIFTAQEKYVTALVFDQAHAQLLAATGGGTGRIYRISTDHSIAPGKPLFTTPEAHLLALAVDKSGSIYAGSAPDGIVYKITPDGKSSVFYDSPETIVSALATDSQGNVYAGTAPSGTVYRIAPDGTAKRLLGRASPGILSLQTDASDAVYAVSGSTVYKINPDDTVQSYVAGADEQFLSLALDTTGSAVYAGTGTVGSVYKIGAPTGSALQGTFQSTVHDTGSRSRWGTITWNADTPTGGSVTLQTRSGDIERPDASWSDWSAPYTNSRGETVTSPPARFLQYQAVLTGDPLGTAPKLRDVSVYYLPRNHAPVVSISKPAAGDAVSKAALLQWSGSDPDRDTLVYDAAYSSDSGKTWAPIKRRAAPDAVKTKGKPSSAQLAEAKANLDKQTNVPPAVRAQILAQMQAAAKTAAPDSPAAPDRSTTDSAKTMGASGLKETSFSWDTTEVPDGIYQIRVTASDKPSNPNGSLTAKTVSMPFLITNTAPTLTTETAVVNADKTVTLHGMATTHLAFVKAVQAKVDGGDPVAAAADDGLFDSTTEPFTLALPALTSGSHKVEVQTVDMAGNTASQTTTVTVP